ncbi:MAG: hypothetical protein AB7I18_05735 [Candidatus Berkiella sp.]
MNYGKTPEPFEDLASLIDHPKLRHYPEQHDQLLKTAFDVGAGAFSAYYEMKKKEEQDKEQKLKPILEQLHSVSQGDPEPLHQALITENLVNLDLSSKLTSYVDPAFYTTLARALVGTPVKTLLINHNSLSSDCINCCISGLPGTNLTRFEFIGAVVNEESAKLLASIIPKTALTSIDFNYNQVSTETDRLIHSFKGLNRMQIFKMSDVLKAASDEEVLHLLEGNEFASEFCSTEDKLNHLRLYLDLVTPQNSFETEVAQDPEFIERRKYK